VVTASVFLSVCLSVRGRMPPLLHGPGCNSGGVVEDAPPLCTIWRICNRGTYGLRCYGNITRTRNISEYTLALALCLVLVLYSFYCAALCVSNDDDDDDDDDDDGLRTVHEH